MNKIMRSILVVFSSSYFFPVSCVSAIILVAMLFSMLDTRVIAKGDKPHQAFYIIQNVEGQGESEFKAIPFDDLPGKYDSAQFLLNKSDGRAFMENGEASFNVLSNEKNKSFIEVKFKADVASGVSKYVSSSDGIVPVYSKIFHKVYMFAASPYATAIALALMFGAKAKLERLDDE